MSVLMEDRADLLHRCIELYRRYVREGAGLPVAAARCGDAGRYYRQFSGRSP